VAACACRMVTIVGNPRPRSRTLDLATNASWALAATLSLHGVQPDQPRVLDLVSLLPALYGNAGQLNEMRQAACDADLLVVASPTLRASYAGLLKLFLDLLPRDGLRGAVAIPLMTAAAQRDRYAVQAHLTPVLRELGATVPMPGLSVLEADLPHAETLVAKWCERTGPVLAAALLAAPARRSLAGGN
jgi:FMN reductase